MCVCVSSDGAALFYASTKEDKNVSLLHKYLLHRAYGLPFKEPACVVDKDAIFMSVVAQLCVLGLSHQPTTVCPLL